MSLCLIAVLSSICHNFHFCYTFLCVYSHVMKIAFRERYLRRQKTRGIFLNFLQCKRGGTDVLSLLSSMETTVANS